MQSVKGLMPELQRNFAFKIQKDSTSEQQRDPTFETPRNLHVGVAEGLVELTWEPPRDSQM